MDDTFVCSCGVTVSKHNVLALTQHVMSPEHEAGMAARKITQHNHSDRWVTPDGLPVYPGTEGARPYRTVNCIACVVDATHDAEFVHDSELPDELCPYVDCEDHPAVRSETRSSVPLDATDLDSILLALAQFPTWFDETAQKVIALRDDL